MWHRFWRRKATLFGFVVVVLFIAVAIAGPYISPNDALKTHADAMLQPPSAQYPLGTDSLGRCVLSRMLHGAAISLEVGLVAVALAMAIGIPPGLVSGFYGSLVDLALMRVVDIFLAFPVMLLALAIIGMLGPSTLNLIIVIGVVSWTRYARVVRAEVLSLKEQDFVLAERALGAGGLRIMARHLLPNVLSPIIVLATYGLAGAILWEAGLSFLGLGVQPPEPSWGNILNEGRAYMRTAPWVATFPGLAIMLVVLGFNFLGDGLRDALDPRLPD